MGKKMVRPMKVKDRKPLPYEPLRVELLYRDAKSLDLLVE